MTPVTARKASAGSAKSKRVPPINTWMESIAATSSTVIVMMSKRAAAGSFAAEIVIGPVTAYLNGVLEERQISGPEAERAETKMPLPNPDNGIVKEFA